MFTIPNANKNVQSMTNTDSTEIVTYSMFSIFIHFNITNRTCALRIGVKRILLGSNITR